jgi:restriction system protein
MVIMQPEYPKLKRTPITPEELVGLEDIQSFLSLASPTVNLILEHCEKKIPFPEPKPPLPEIPLKPTKPNPPALPKEPEYPKEELEKIRIKWFHWLIGMSRREDIKRITSRYDLDLSNYHREKNKIEERYERALEFYEKKYIDWKSNRETRDKDYQYLSKIWLNKESKWEADYQNERKYFEESFHKASQGHNSSMIGSTKLILCNSKFPPCVSRDAEVFHNNESKLLLINFFMPYMPSVRIAKIKHLTNIDKIVDANKTETKKAQNLLLFAIPLYVCWQIAKSNFSKNIELIAFNGITTYKDPTTGLERTDCTMSLLVKTEDIAKIDIRYIDPKKSFYSLKGIVGASPVDYVPVQPLISFDRKDRRFIESREILAQEEEYSNLATLDWEDFEHLVRELFEKEFGTGGAEVRVTQASRDRGVDAIAFDTDPIRGGKFVIQAKRYTNVVEVSAVRDLYGTVLNEGANRGILVTTSTYGADAYEFAKDKPITLLSGNELLYLLSKHGYNFRIDLVEAKRLLKEQ